MTALLVFLAQFFYILLLGLQQLNVVGKHYSAAAIVSLVLGIFGYHITATIALHAAQPTFSMVWWAYIAAGPLGILVSMWLHPRVYVWLSNGKGKKAIAND